MQPVLQYYNINNPVVASFPIHLQRPFEFRDGFYLVTILSTNTIIN